MSYPHINNFILTQIQIVLPHLKDVSVVLFIIFDIATTSKTTFQIQSKNDKDKAGGV